MSELSLSREELARYKILLEKKARLAEDLPHRYGWKRYTWQRQWEDCHNRMAFCTASNQSGKSVCNLSKAIDWMGSRDKWRELWPESDFYQGWYLYPNQETLNREFETKWKKFLPGPRLKNDKTSPWYWKEFKGTGGRLAGIQFGYGDSSVPLYFLTYTQKISGQQASSVNFLSADEELPVASFSEYKFRLMATKGYFSMVFTATLGQEEWRLTMEPEPHEEEKFPEAFKIRVSMFDCLRHEDGSPGHITEEDIKHAIATCISEEEVQRRVYGRFVRSDGRLVPHYSSRLHLADLHPLPGKWSIYAGVDTGSSGKTGHPAAVLFLAVNPEKTEGRFFRAWRGERKAQTTAGDTFEKFLALSRDLSLTGRVYDYSDADFNIIATRAGHPFIRADKNRDRGWKMLDTLFQYNRLKVYRDKECMKLSAELSSLNDDTKRAGRMDDLADCARYLVMVPQWNWKEILKNSPATYQKEAKNLLPGTGEGDFYGTSGAVCAERPRNELLAAHEASLKEMEDDLESEFDEWNDCYEI